MSKTNHLFFIQSDFHYMICKSIIARRKLDLKQCSFICRRGMKVEDGINISKLFNSRNICFNERLKYLLFHYKEINNIFVKNDVVVYLPFRFQYPSKLYFKEIVFFEEGFSAYKSKIPKYKESCINRIERIIMRKVLSLIFNKGVCGFLMFNDVIDHRPRFDLKLYICSSNAYRAIKEPKVKKEILPIFVKPQIKYEIPTHSYFIVLERFANDAGRTCSVNSYIICVKKMLSYCKEHGVCEVWTKFHPADWNNPDAIRLLEGCNADYNLKIHFFDGRLEFLALQNNGIIFVSTSSTILYYAPILGKTNKSISFCRYLASIDDRYVNFMNSFGGTDAFVSIFSEYVKCLELSEC